MSTPTERPPGITARQRRFVEEYVVDRNATQAYFRAFGRTTAAGTRRSYRAAQVSASRLLSDPIIQAEVEAASRAQSRRTRVTADRWVRALSQVAFADLTDCYQADAENAGLPPAAAAVIRRALAEATAAETPGPPSGQE